MREIFIKYNPYKVETRVQIDGKPIKANSALNVDDRRLQEWIEELPKILVEECNTKEFRITFHGTVLDYEDLLSVTKDAKEKGIDIICYHRPAKEVKDKEQAIKDIFYDIQNGPFDELKQTDVKRAFEMASSSDFEVNVVATMSAGKSTLINALLRQKLMPAKQEACTATITKIKDKDLDPFRATVYDKNGDLLETHMELSLEVMDKLNSNPIVSNISIEGNIPFVTADDVSLVLVDTPGPNNSRDPEHKAATYRMLSESSKTVVLYILNATQLAINDDNDLLNHVADSMGVGGKQSKDRFIFVVNKLDDFKQGEDSVVGSIQKVRKYLEDKGIKNPNIFPAAALPALDIRTSLKNVDLASINFMDDDISPNIMEAITKVKKLNRNEELHLETYAPLTPSVRGEITSQLAIAKDSNDKYTEALIHTGIIPIESSIKMYVAKYAKTAKIKNIVDTFSKKLESARSFENTKQEIALNQNKRNEILSQIEAIEAKLKNGQEAKKFKDKIEAINYDSEIKSITSTILMEAQKKISSQNSKDDSKLTQRDAESMCKVFGKFAEGLQAEVQVKLEKVITDYVEKNAKDLLDQYKERISALAQDIEIGTVTVNPFELLHGEIDGGTMANIKNLITNLTKTESIKVGEKWVENSDKKWYKPWTWFDEDGYYKDVYENKEYVDASELTQRFFAPIQKQLFKNSDNAMKYAKEQSNYIKTTFRSKFVELDEVLSKKLHELEHCAKDSKNVEAMIKETQKRLEWLQDIQSRIESILDI
ncbi:dynamin family protein [Alkaliphilus peptidifermentans]|uniref:Dynamin family protein n=1 Tax=Alkaliphilus peptidifermentans DSM 18978 TaxID=1120976 RepID=A0A1G5EB94_9FIRM|nr:dynamin family protein [Alkaliphilus peptidifermentans]SCY24175.1 Dynamin family protein [Alkaliphilus peptidifermentans DSM 18978]